MDDFVNIIHITILMIYILSNNVWVQVKRIKAFDITYEINSMTSSKIFHWKRGRV
jgi:hypothetical protein